MITLEQIKTFDGLHSKFINECKRVANILENYRCWYEPTYECIHYAEDFYPCGNDVYWKGRDEDNDLQDGEFPIIWLTMTDEEVHVAAAKKNEEYLERVMKEKEEKERKKQEADYAAYLRLKKRFETDFN